MSVSASIASWTEKVERLSLLKPGWDSYSAPPPSSQAIELAKKFLEVMSEHGCEPTRLNATAVGGVSITVASSDRKVYIEFYNDGIVCSLFGIGQPDAEARQVTADKPCFAKLIGEIQEYLDAGPAS